jgi:CRP-like cAMP-binding protein
MVIEMSKPETAVPALARGITTGGRHGPPGAPVGLLGQVPLFAGLSRRHLRQVARLSEAASFHAGRTVVQFGSRGNAFYVIVEGTAKVTVGYSSRTIRKLGPGDFFGELALLDGQPRSASVTAETDLTTIRLGRPEFRRLLRREPDVALKLLEELSLRLRGASRGRGVN